MNKNQEGKLTKRAEGLGDKTNNNRSAWMRDPDGNIGIKTEAILLTRRFPDLMVGVAGNSTCRSSRLL